MSDAIYLTLSLIILLKHKNYTKLITLSILQSKSRFQNKKNSYKIIFYKTLNNKYALSLTLYTELQDFVCF